ncbi:helix-turn-helix domain-containing protein [Nocardiopsis halophila]|uniref:helix-turn-helix domain-containing protein n=1 Tax=Nocardiopsis halophila TaxID=141692 RepID=UPI000347E3D1|nr:helix-turn-helix transcriptional regulator [Nocardiopsis halophila]
MSERIRNARKARGWSQERLIREIQDRAASKALAVASKSSLKVYVSEWENGRRTVSSPYKEILRTVLGMTDDELFPEQDLPITAVDGYDELLERLESARTVSKTVVETLNSQTELLRTVDRQMGAAQLVDQMGAHIKTLNEALTFAVLPQDRRPIAEALAGASSLAAWQALDVGAIERAWRHYELAKTSAREAEEPKFLVHAMGEQAYVLVDSGKPDLALQLAQEAVRQAEGKVSPRLMAWLYAAEAEFQALNGDLAACHERLGQAERTMPADDLLRDPDMPSIFLTSNHLTRWRGHTLALAGDDQAVTDLYGVLEAMDPTFTRAEAGVRSNLAHAHLVRKEYAEAMSQLQKARLLANRTGSVRHRRRIDQLNGLL